MKKMQALMVGILTIVLSFCCFASCALLKAGKYELVSYKTVVGSPVEASEDNDSYVELKMDNTAEIYIKIPVFDDIKGEGTWEENADGTITLRIGDLELSATLEDGELVVDLIVGTATFKK